MSAGDESTFANTAYTEDSVSKRLVFSHVNEATMRVLTAEGCEVLAPAAQGCCGALALHAGRPR